MGNCNRFGSAPDRCKAVPPAVQHGWENVRYDPSETWAAEGGLWIVREEDEDYGWKRIINLKFKKDIPFISTAHTLKEWIFCLPTCMGAPRKWLRVHPEEMKRAAVVSVAFLLGWAYAEEAPKQYPVTKAG